MNFIIACTLLFHTSSEVIVTRGDIEAVITEYITAQINDPDERFEIEFRSVPSSIAIDAREFDIGINPDRGLAFRGNISLPVDIIADGKFERRIIVSMRIRRFADVYMTANTLTRHTPVEQSDLVRIRVETTALPDDIVMSMGELHNKRTNRILQEGVIIRSSMVEEIPIVSFGNRVIVEVRTGPVVVTTSGISREEGRKGDIISVQRDGTHERLRARIIDSTRVELVSEREMR
jgi:flagella basal body P-ring formation protein FlgA